MLREAGTPATLCLILLWSCSPPPSPAVARPVTSTARPSAAPGAAPAPDAGVVATADGMELVAGCTSADAAALRNDISEGISQRLYAEQASAAAILRELQTVWGKPCLAHLARFMSPPGAVSLKALRDAWGMGFGSNLADAVGGLRVSEGKRVFVIPQEVLPELTEDARRELTPFLCRDADPSCARSSSYVARAEGDLDRAATLDAFSRRPPPGSGPGYGVFAPPSLCDAKTLANLSPPTPGVTPFEAWAACAVGQAPYSYRYADVRLRAPDRGWLFLRGRRGHYQFADEVRAYDLATGAAYVARQEGGLILGGVDFAPGAARTPAASTGKVSADQLRELAFVLTTRAAITQLRTQPAWITVPDDVPLALGSASRLDIGTGVRLSWSSDAQTDIAWSLVADGGAQTDGHFTWPDSADRIEDHIDHLVTVLEAGLVPGCAPARLPARRRGHAGAVSSLDADPSALADVHTELEKRLDALGSRVCAGVK